VSQARLFGTGQLRRGNGIYEDELELVESALVKAELYAGWRDLRRLFGDRERAKHTWSKLWSSTTITDGQRQSGRALSTGWRMGEALPIYERV